MSARPSPQSSQASHVAGQSTRNDFLLTLDFSDPKLTLDGQDFHELAPGMDSRETQNAQQLQFRVSPVGEPAIDPESTMSRSTSATSSVNPYYFGVRSPLDSPVPPLPSPRNFTASPEMRHFAEPITPAKDPATIDRRGLIGVGELATPRWTQVERYREEDSIGGHEPEPDSSEEGLDLVLPHNENDVPDSPWTIEAVDGESDDREEQPVDLVHLPHAIRPRPSMTSESGGEEILYPRKTDLSKFPKPPGLSEPELAPEVPVPISPPSSFSIPPRRARKRDSEEFEMDHAGNLTLKRVLSSQPKDKGKEEKLYARKHRSLGVGMPSTNSTRDKGKERRRETVGLTINGSLKPAQSVSKADKYSQQASASSSSSNHDNGPHSRLVHTTDFSHLPPSPSSSSIQHFLKHTSSTQTPPLIKDPYPHSSPNVAHSLLRGTQEGWSVLDDEATAEALRKLDGLSGKGARARASVGSFTRSGSISRPGTPSGKTGTQWEGIEASKVLRSHSIRRESTAGNEKENGQRATVGLGFVSGDPSQDSHELIGLGSSDDTQGNSSVAEKAPKKTATQGARSSFTPKRASASSTTYTSTPSSSRDSGSLSTATSVTSASVASVRHSMSKSKRNSAGSDVSSNHSGDATSLKDRVASLAVANDAPEDDFVPPVPPLPKDLSNYRSPPQSTTSLAFPTMGSSDGKRCSNDSDPDRTISLEVPPFEHDAPNASSHPSRGRQHSQHYPQISDSAAPVLRTPSKKWSFSNAFNLISGSPSSSSSGFPLSPRSLTFGHELRKTDSKEQVSSPINPPKSPWLPKNPDGMASAGSLVSLSSTGSGISIPPPVAMSGTPVRTSHSRSETNSSESTNHTTSVHPQAPLSPASSLRRGPSSKRLTPSSIPFFRRSSSQSVYVPPSEAVAMPSSPTLSSTSTPARSKASTSPSKDLNLPSPHTRGSAQKKSSVLSLGLPSLLKGSSSRRSLHADRNEASDLRECQQSFKEAAKEREKLAKEKDKERERAARERERFLKEKEKSDKEKEKLEKEKQRKDDKDRSESRISSLMGRKRGKTLSSAAPKKEKEVQLPPMQMSGIPPVTAQRVASLRSSISSASAAVPVPPASRTSSSSRLTSQTVSSMQKQSETSLRTRNLLPTIAGSPSVGTNSSKDSKELPPSTLTNSASGLPKETPTKIPRISSRTSAIPSPTLKNSLPSSTSRRSSLHASGLVAPSTDPSPTPGEPSTNEFGVVENGWSQTAKPRHSVRASPSTSTSRVPRQVSTQISSVSSSILPRKNRESMSFSGLRKSSTGSVASISSVPQSESHHRFAGLSPSKGLKLLSPKMSTTRASNSNSTSTQNIHQVVGSPSSSRQSLSTPQSTPSPVSSAIDEEEALGDEEMMHYIRKQQTKKMANGATQEELDDLLRFPEPLPPMQPSSPAAVLKSNHGQYLSNYERKEILDYSSVFCIGARSKKKPATYDDSSNNHGYDDDRGDYLVVNHDHLAYRYEIVDTLGKGSFGQVLHCRDHCTGESVAIKIIRNKKRFHHQALVEIKILDNLRKWDNEGKHHVIKMTEHFYFRNHLCIAMELLSINLYELIKANGFVGFTTALIRRFTSQMLLSLSLMRHHRIVHCDLKPENVLLRHPAKSAIKVIDFGSSCFEHEKIYTYIQSRFYRSPEVILGMNYHMAIDMWSLGCILAELFTGYPIFPGENEQEQLSCIMEVLGIPEREFVNRSSRKKLFFDPNGSPRAVINSKGRRRRPGTKTLAQVLRCNDEEFVDFIGKCLVWDPERRIKPQAAMRHPFVTGSRAKPRTLASSSSAAKALSSSSNLGLSRGKTLTETPKKSQISAPTPLTARSVRVAANTVSSVPSSASVHSSTIGSSSRSFRSSQSQGMSSYHSSRTLTTTAAK